MFMYAFLWYQSETKIMKSQVKFVSQFMTPQNFIFGEDCEKLKLREPGSQNSMQWVENPQL